MAGATLLADAPTDRWAAPLIGKRPPEWTLTDWLHSKPLTLSNLRGKVVLIRWWTAPDCPYCRATAPALNYFYNTYHAQGLEVIGIYHHKGCYPLDAARVKREANTLGFKFPVAVDPQWQTLHRWWLDTGRRQWTSVSFLLDRQGIIRYIQPGGEYVKGDADYASLQAEIQELLKRH